MSTLDPLPATQSRPGTRWHVVLWIVQWLLGLLFLMLGAVKAVHPAQIPWSADVGEPVTRFIGICEILGGVGLVLPSAARLKPGLTALAGAGLAIVMALASIFHTIRGEFHGPPVNLGLGGLAAWVAWGRFKKAPIAPR
jgi:hypothetical protein